MSENEIIEMLGQVIAKIHEGLTITTVDYKGVATERQCPQINYVFGNSRDVKARLDEMSKCVSGTATKLPMIALFTPVNERRNTADYYTTAKVNLIIAHTSQQQWNNEQRLSYSFRGVLRPIYNRLMELLKADRRFDFGYHPLVKHEYSENYSYGKYGALTSTGEKLSEPIDAIDIRNLELKIKLQKCR